MIDRHSIYIYIYVDLYLYIDIIEKFVIKKKKKKDIIEKFM